MGDTPTIPVNGEDWDADRLADMLRNMRPGLWSQLHWRIYLLVHTDEHEQANVAKWLWSWEWLQAHDGHTLPGVDVTL